MNSSASRRDFLKAGAAVGAGLGLVGLGGHPLWAAAAGPGAPHAEKLGWRLGCQSYSFNRFTFFESIDKNASLGLKVIEGFPGQRISKTIGTGLGEGLSADARKEVKQKLADSGIKLVNFGVAGSGRSTFEFAKDMGIETIVSEPAENSFDTLDKLCEEYQIHIAIHNHPQPSHYWNPDTVLKVCKGRSKWIGACADTGHWMRSGLDPVECLKKLEGRIVSFHFKDLNEMGPGAHDVPWGTGKGNVKGMLAEIYRQKLKAVFSIEYEYHWENSVPDMVESVAYFDKVAAELAGT
jgi:sugar phosphate isomerase/epimerase